MDYKLELYAIPGGVGYRITLDGAAVQVQDYDPDQPGNTPMTEARALEAAEAVLTRLLS